MASALPEHQEGAADGWKAGSRFRRRLAHRHYSRDLLHRRLSAPRYLHGLPIVVPDATKYLEILQNYNTNLPLILASALVESSVVDMSYGHSKTNLNVYILWSVPHQLGRGYPRGHL